MVLYKFTFLSLTQVAPSLRQHQQQKEETKSQKRKLKLKSFFGALLQNNIYKIEIYL